MFTEKDAQSLVPTEEKSLPTNNSGKITENILLFCATNSFFCKSDLRNFFYSTLIPGPASFYSAIYTDWFVHTTYQHGGVVMQQKQ